MLILDAVGLAVAVVAAGRSTWSPCGLSMLSSITPMGERGRGNRFRRTAAWFIVGSVAGGLCLGGVTGLVALGWAALGVPHSVALLLGGLCALLAVLADLGLLGFELPLFRRQVNERWLDQFRGGVYGLGFGWQIGVGVATYIMTSAVLLIVALGVLSGHPLIALAEGGAFGTVRGLTVLLGVRATNPEALLRIHRRLDGYRGAVRASTIGAEGAALLVLAGCWWWPSLLVVGPVGLGFSAGALLRLRLRRHRPGALVRT